MSHNLKIHAAQVTILRELLFNPEAGFAVLQKPTGLSSDHFNFHIKKLIELDLVEKVGRGNYRLTQAGKEYANKLDTDSKTIERQPKTAVLLSIQRGEGDDREFVFQQRLKHPYYGFWGFPTGKIRWGETILDAAARELDEETGLSADYEYGGLYHEQVQIKGSDEIIEDKIFHIISCTNVKGELQEEFEGGRNQWHTRTEIEQQPKKYDSYEIEIDMIFGKYDRFIENIVEVEDADF